MAISRDRAREIVEKLKCLTAEADVQFVFPPRSESQRQRLSFVDMVFSVVSPRGDDSDAQIEIITLKSREPKPEPYTTMRAESSFCPHCDERVTLLSNGERPRFYLCWGCRWIGEVGVGQVSEFREPPEEDDDAAGH